MGTPERTFGISEKEFMSMLDNPSAMEQCAAQICPEVYTKGLEIGTVAAKGIGRYKESDYEDRSAYRTQKRELEAEGWKAIEVDDDIWPWAIKAMAYGIDAGIEQPLERFEVRGVAS